LGNIKLHWWLPQEYPKSPPHPNLEKEIRQGTRRAERAEREFNTIRKKYQAIQPGARPFSLKMIEVKAKYRRARLECTQAKEQLKILLAIKKARKKR
jgi:hypothetical protein